MHKFYQSRKVVTVFWFDPNEEHIMHHHPDHCHTDANVSHGPNSNASALNTVWENTRAWSLTPEFLEEEKAKQKVKVQSLADYVPDLELSNAIIFIH
jgi:hypothetical protein